MRDAPNTVFVRCLYVSKEAVDEDTQELLQKSCKQIIGTTPARNYAKYCSKYFVNGEKRRRDEFYQIRNWMMVCVFDCHNS